MKHYTSEQLDQFKHGDMTLVQRFVCRIHLHICSDCRKQLNSIADDDSFVSELKNAVKQFDVPPDEKELNTLCSIFKDDNIKHSNSV